MLKGFSLIALFCAVLMAAPAMAAVVYQNDFQASVGAEWSLTNRETSPVGSRTFLGRFDNQTATLTLSGLSAHDSLAISFDLFIMDSWDGNTGGVGPDMWSFSLDGATYLNTTFSNVAGSPQAYPGNYPGGNFAPMTGAEETNTLGYNFYGNAVYHFDFVLAHVGDQAVISFAGAGLQGVPDESWGLDNVLVEASGAPVPVPAAAWLLGSGLVGLAGLRRKLFR